ncbi:MULTISPECIES: hypothetical protein [unclassified Methylobacterium]|uniref:hypothetical protein n=1 Tax=unclassified Methylobacterium TaxID=2615210 RepID=UPI000377DEB2|nr:MULTISPECIES: hypothetical protein [Methylobacterium]WFT78653.1 hypothetical protein QA634_25790 [Methylobacterium nodulans]
MIALEHQISADHALQLVQRAELPWIELDSLVLYHLVSPLDISGKPGAESEAMRGASADDPTAPKD